MPPPQSGGGAVAPSATRGSSSPLKALLALIEGLRPKQWAKNTLVFAGLLFTLDKHHPPADYLRALAAFALFCLLSGCVYLINDAKDYEADRVHPRKRKRPIASGRLSRRLAIAFAAVGAPVALLLAFVGVNVWFGVVALVYFVLTLAYTLHLKNVVIVDVMIVAAGFILRAVAGTAVIEVPSTQWLLTCTGLLALFIAVAKRRSELAAHIVASTAEDTTLPRLAPASRPILGQYSLPLLDQMITVVATSCLISYFLYSFSSDTGHSHPYLMATAPFVLYGLFRYLYLMLGHGKGEAPEEILMTDRPMQINLLLWIASVAAALLV